MVNIDKVTRIIISSNSKMDLIIKWYQDNQDLEFISPIDKGYVELKEESLGFSFEHKNNIANICIYAYSSNNNLHPIVSFDYNPKTDTISNELYHCPTDRIQYMRAILKVDNTIGKEILKYRAIMNFMVYHREYVIADNTKASTGAHQSHKVTSNHHTNSLSSKIYISDSISKKNLRITSKHNSPSYEFEVRGFYRHYKSGKVVWVDGFTKGKGKGKKQAKEYKF